MTCHPGGNIVSQLLTERVTYKNATHQKIIRISDSDLSTELLRNLTANQIYSEIASQRNKLVGNLYIYLLSTILFLSIPCEEKVLLLLPTYFNVVGMAKFLAI